MLVITRKVGEQIRIADDVVVEVLDITGSTVRLGFAAPTEIPILRQELWLERQAAVDDPTEPAPPPPA
jgi:carbon storage regulator